VEIHAGRELISHFDSINSNIVVFRIEDVGSVAPVLNAIINDQPHDRL
jgi:hypothetical protein